MKLGSWLALLFTLVTVSVVASQSGGSSVAKDSRVFEMRTYYAAPGKLEDLQARFRNHTTKLFERHGIVNVGYWTAADAPNTLVYIVAHKSQEEAKKSWTAFRADAEWVKVRAETEAAGLTGVKVESKYLLPTDYSPMK